MFITAKRGDHIHVTLPDEGGALRGTALHDISHESRLEMSVPGITNTVTVNVNLVDDIRVLFRADVARSTSEPVKSKEF